MSSGANDYSYSKVETYESCPFKFWLKYIQDIKVFSATISTELGTAIHACEEEIARSIKAKEKIKYNKLKNELILKLAELEHKYPADFNQLDKSNRTVSEKVYEYLAIGIYKLEQYMNEHPTYEIVGIEQEFHIKYTNDYTFNGFIDRVFHDTLTDKYIIQDIKTYAIPVDKSKLITPLQFFVYSLAAKELYGCTEDQITCQYYLPFCDLTQETKADGFIARGIDKIDLLFGEIGKENFTPNPTPLCAWCEFSASNTNAPQTSKYCCPYFCHWTRENKVFSRENNWQGMENNTAIMESYKAKVERGDM